MIPENFKESSDPISAFTTSLIEISKECIPQTSTNPTKSNPWYNDDCKEAIKQRKQALSKLISTRHMPEQPPKTSKTGHFGVLHNKSSYTNIYTHVGSAPPSYF